MSGRAAFERFAQQVRQSQARGGGGGVGLPPGLGGGAFAVATLLGGGLLLSSALFNGMFQTYVSPAQS